MGVEPIRCHHQRILSPSRLPIPTHRLVNSDIIITALRRVVKPGGGICHFLKKQIFLKNLLTNALRTAIIICVA